MLLSILLLVSPGLAADATQPHPHQGVVSPFPANPPKPTLTEADLALLRADKPVMKQTQGETGGRGIAIQDVKATPEVVWGRILDFAAYPRMVDNVSTCEVYDRSDDHIKARFILKAPLVTVEYFIDHVVNTDAGWMTWTLDYTRESDLDDSVGFWRVEALPDRPGYSRVFYSVDVRLKGWVPGVVETIIAKQGLTKATEWVKRESEAG